MDTRQNDTKPKTQGAAQRRKTSAGSQRPRNASPARTRNPAASSARARASAGTAVKTRPAAPKRRRRKSNAPDVVYTAATPFSRGRLLTGLLSVVAVVLAVVFGITIFFHVDTVTVSGAEKYDEWTIREASGIQNGDNLLLLSDAEIAGNITTKLPYVKSVRVGIKLPNTVNIYIEEQDILYAVRDTGNRLWLISTEGIVVDVTNTGEAGTYPNILGVQLYMPVQSQQAVAADEEQGDTPTATTEDGEPVDVPVTIFGADRLNAAMEVLQYFEKYRMIDKIVSVDVTDMGNITVVYGQQYEINLGNKTEMAVKVEMAAKGIAKLDEQYDQPIGKIDLSFRTQRDLIFTFDYLNQG